MGKAIVVTSGKGGVGKTTVAANIAAALSESGARVAAVDMDIGLRNLDVALGVENSVLYNILDVAQNKCRLKQALIKHKRYPSLYILPASQTAEKDDLSEQAARDVVSELKEMFDYVIIDCPAGIERGFKNSVVAADEALVVTSPEISAVRDADRVIGIIGKRLPVSLVINKIRPEMLKKGEIMSVADITDILNIPLIGVIPDLSEVICSLNSGEPLSGVEKSFAGAALRNIAQRLMGKKVEFTELKPKKTFWEKIGIS